MHPKVKQARIAGLYYALMGLPAPFALIYVPAKLIAVNDAAATAANVLAAETMFRWAVLAEVVSAVGFLLFAAAIYRLLRDVDVHLARLLVIFIVVQVAITFVAAAYNAAALAVFKAPPWMAAIGQAQRENIGYLFLRLHAITTLLNQLFWGLWLFPFGRLVMKSRFIPRLLGVLLLANGAAYIVAAVVALLAPAYQRVAFNAALPALFGELWIMIWLIAKGVNVSKLPAHAPAGG